MRDAVIVDAVRTPIGRRRGALSGIHPADLSAHVLESLVERTGLDPAVIDDVVWGCVSQTSEQAGNVARTAILAAGWPESVPGTTVTRACGSSQQALSMAAAAVISGQLIELSNAGRDNKPSLVVMGTRAGTELREAGDNFSPLWSRISIVRWGISFLRNAARGARDLLGGLFLFTKTLFILPGREGAAHRD